MNTSMDTSTTDVLKNELYNANQTFRDLVQKHGNCEKRLSELAALTYPNEKEILEETTLKKKKLLLKDEIQNMMRTHSNLH